MEAIQILMTCNLEDRSGTLTGDTTSQSVRVQFSHDRIGQEIHPDSVPSDAVFCDDLLLVRDPIEVPSVQGRGIVDPKHIDRFDLEIGGFQLLDDPT
jgi:hypothetical protein